MSEHKVAFDEKKDGVGRRVMSATCSCGRTLSMVVSGLSPDAKRSVLVTLQTAVKEHAAKPQ